MMHCQSTFKKYGKEEVENLKWENSARQVREVYTAVIVKLKNL